MLKVIMTRSALIAFAYSLSFAAHAYAVDPKPITVPAGDLTIGLESLAKQAHVELVYQTEALKGMHTNGVSGTLSPQDAVTKLLEGTALTVRTDSSGAMLIAGPLPRGPASGTQSATDEKPSMRQPKEKPTADSSSKSGFWDRFRLAQVDQVKLSQTTTLGSDTAPQDRSQNTQISEIVVTANKRAEKIQDVAASVSVERGETLIARGQTQLVDYAANMPGFNVASNGSPGQTSVSMRGISSNTSTSAIGTYLDDTPIGSSSAWAIGSGTLLDMLPYDLDRLEVLRGPQGTLYGEGAMGGLIKYVLKAPSTTEVGVNLGADVSTIDGASSAGYSFRARANAPIISDILGVSLSAFEKKTPGFMTNLYTGQRDTNANQQYGARFAALWTPSSNVSVKLSALTQTIEANDLAVKQFANANRAPTSDGSLVLTPAEPLPKLTENFAFLSPYDQRINYFSATVDWNAGPIDFVSASSYSSQRSFLEFDSTPQVGSILNFLGGTAPGLVKFVDFFGLDKFTQEFRLASPKGGAIEWLFGVFDTHEHSFNTESYQAFDTSFRPTAPAFPPGLFYILIPETLDEYAAFGNVTWNLNGAFSITGGARYAKNDQDINFNVAPGPFVSETGLIHIGTHEGVFTWMGTAAYHFNQDTMSYARVATGYRPGGPNSPLPGIPPTYSSDSLINYELGLKSNFLDRKAQVDVAVYRIDWKDIQLIAIDSSNGLSFLANGGKAVSQGLEFASLYSPVSGLELGLNAAYTDAHLTSVSAASRYLKTGYQSPIVPKESFSFTANYDWEFAGKWRAQVGAAYRYVGKQWLSIVEGGPLATAPAVQAPGYSVVDLNASVRQNRVTFKFYVRNVADNLAITGPSGSGGGNLVVTNSATGAQQINTSFVQPRTIGLGVDYAF